MQYKINERYKYLINIVDDILLLIGAGTITVWGVVYIILVWKDMRLFTGISDFARRVLLLQWVSQGLAMVFMGVIVWLCVSIGGTENAFVHILCWAIAVFLFVFALIGLAARLQLLALRLSPLFCGISAVLIVLALSAFA